MTKNEYELTRTDSLCPSPEELLLDYVRKNDPARIENLIRDHPHLLSHIYGYPHNKTILQICCCKEDVQLPIIELLVRLGANLFFAQEVDFMRNALHIAAQYGTPEVLRVVVKCMQQQAGKGSINEADANGNTALLIVMKEREQDGAALQCARVLIENGIDVNRADGKQHTAILWAAKEGFKEMVRLLLQQGNVDVDGGKLRGKTARQWIEEKRLVDEDALIDYPTTNNNQNAKDILFGYLKENRESDFVNYSKISDYVDGDDGVNTLLQLACKNGLKNAVRHLLNHKADPNHVTFKNPKTPLEIISELGYYEIFKLLLQNDRIKITSNVICNVFKYMDRTNMGNSNYEICYQLLRERITDAIVNTADSDKNTPLHYAVFYSKPECVLDLLDLGASLANKNQFNISPIQNIHADLLEQHLDRCVTAENVKEGDVDENCVVTFNYRTLVPQTPPTDVVVEKSIDVEEQNPLREMQELVAETEVVSYISQSSELRHLLKHPVLASFLFMKWHRIRWFFYTNLTFYLTFCLSLILYILLNCTNEDNNSNNSVFSNVILVLLSVTYVILILRELFQMFVSPKTYFCSFENWVEICLIAVTLCIFLDENDNKQFSAIAVLLATFELTMLVGQHPKICTNVVMLRTVSCNFFKILLWFSVLILAFAFSFYVLFHQTANEKTAQNATDETVDFFGDPGLSVLKTIVMLTGEFDASSMNFTTFPLASRLIFLMFVFMIAIILFNLLNGLAVSDTQMIKNDAELIGLVARAQHIRYIESMILGNILPTSILKFVKNVCCCLPITHKSYLAIPRILAERVCLFPRFLPNFLLKFYPVKCGEVIIECPQGTDKCFACCNKLYLDGKTVRRTLGMLHQRKATKTTSNVDGIIKEMQERIEQLQQQQADVLKKVDLILQSLKK